MPQSRRRRRNARHIAEQKQSQPRRRRRTQKQANAVTRFDMRDFVRENRSQAPIVAIAVVAGRQLVGYDNQAVGQGESVAEAGLVQAQAVIERGIESRAQIGDDGGERGFDPLFVVCREGAIVQPAVAQFLVCARADSSQRLRRQGGGDSARGQRRAPSKNAPPRSDRQQRANHDPTPPRFEQMQKPRRARAARLRQRAVDEIVVGDRQPNAVGENDAARDIGHARRDLQIGERRRARFAVGVLRAQALVLVEPDLGGDAARGLAIEPIGGDALHIRPTSKSKPSTASHSSPSAPIVSSFPRRKESIAADGATKRKWAAI